jgi:hypothetical protein
MKSNSNEAGKALSLMNKKFHCLFFGLVLLTGILQASARDLAPGYSSFIANSNLEIRIYPERSLEPDAIWKIDRIVLEHKRIGFFSVQLMPHLVVEGIQLEFTRTNPPANWLDGFRCEWVPAENRSALEWRNFNISFPQETIPRLHAGRAHPVAHAGSLICRLEDVTLQGGSGPVHLPRAEVRMEGQAGRIAWQDSGRTIQWDLFSSQFITSSIIQRTPNEKL